MSVYCIRDTTVDGCAAVTLAGDELAATFVPGLAMLCCSLRHVGEELLDVRGGVARYAEHGSTLGIPLLHPWANRLGGFRYSAAGRQVDLDPESAVLHRDANGLPMHGVQPARLPWQVVSRNADHVEAVLQAQLEFASPDMLAVFPFPHVLQMDVRVRNAMLSVSMTVRPNGAVAVPVSFGFHPYLRLPGMPRAQWWIEVPVRRTVVLDERQIPTGATAPVSIAPGPLADRAFDAGFDVLEHPTRFILAGGGRRITLEFLAGYSFAQIYAPAKESFICFEPMTAPTNALVSGVGLSTVEPGATYTAAFVIAIE
jgi:aldose 1-epimerase